MSNWKNHAYLFANGNFKVTSKEFGRDEKPYGLTIHRLSEIIKYNMLGNCQLIARPFDDITNGEMNQIERMYKVRYKDQYNYDGEIMLYLLSVGILPPSFDAKDVIFKPKTEQP